MVELVSSVIVVFLIFTETISQSLKTHPLGHFYFLVFISMNH